ncbi:hypothetical protein ACLB1E_31040 [Escherichia coli]
MGAVFIRVSLIKELKGLVKNKAFLKKSAMVSEFAHFAGFGKSIPPVHKPDKMCALRQIIAILLHPFHICRWLIASAAPDA